MKLGLGCALTASNPPPGLDPRPQLGHIAVAATVTPAQYKSVEINVTNNRQQALQVLPAEYLPLTWTSGFSNEHRTFTQASQSE